MVETSQYRFSDHRSIATRASRQRALESEAPVWAIGVVVIDVLGEQSMEVPLVDDDHVVQTLRAFERTTRSPMAFARGARTGVRTLPMPSLPSRAPNVRP